MKTARLDQLAKTIHGWRPGFAEACLAVGHISGDGLSVTLTDAQHARLVATYKICLGRFGQRRCASAPRSPLP